MLAEVHRWQRSSFCGIFQTCPCPSCPTSPSWEYPPLDAWTSCVTYAPWSKSWTPWQSPFSSSCTGCSVGCPGSCPGCSVVQAPCQTRRWCHLWGGQHRPSDVLSAADLKKYFFQTFSAAIGSTAVSTHDMVHV